MKRTITLATLGLALAATTAMAQTTPPHTEPQQRSMPAPTGPLTQSEVNSRITASGYTGVTNVEKSGTSWTAKAMKDGKPVDLTVDSTGTVRMAGTMAPAADMSTSPRGTTSPPREGSPGAQGNQSGSAPGSTGSGTTGGASGGGASGGGGTAR